MSVTYAEVRAFRREAESLRQLAAGQQGVVVDALLHAAGSIEFLVDAWLTITQQDKQP